MFYIYCNIKKDRMKEKLVEIFTTLGFMLHSDSNPDNPVVFPFKLEVKFLDDYIIGIYAYSTGNFVIDIYKRRGSFFRKWNIAQQPFCGSCSIDLNNISALEYELRRVSEGYYSDKGKPGEYKYRVRKQTTSTC